VGQLLASELQSGRASGIDHLKVTQFMKKNIVEQEAAHGQRRPFLARPGPELFGSLTLDQGSPQAHPWRESAQHDLTVAPRDIAESSREAVVVKMNSAQPLV
jgi:hypothetical protein